MRTFDSLRQQNDLPNSYLFIYLQLRHVFRTQFGNQLLSLYALALENLFRDETLVKL